MQKSYKLMSTIVALAFALMFVGTPAVATASTTRVASTHSKQVKMQDKKKHDLDLSNMPTVIVVSFVTQGSRLVEVEYVVFSFVQRASSPVSTASYNMVASTSGRGTIKLSGQSTKAINNDATRGVLKPPRDAVIVRAADPVEAAQTRTTREVPRSRFESVASTRSVMNVGGSEAVSVNYGALHLTC